MDIKSAIIYTDISIESSFSYTMLLFFFCVCGSNQAKGVLYLIVEYIKLMSVNKSIELLDYIIPCYGHFAAYTVRPVRQIDANAQINNSID